MDELAFESELSSPEEMTGGWVFASVPADVSDDVSALGGPPRGFGSVRVGLRVLDQ